MLNDIPSPGTVKYYVINGLHKYLYMFLFFIQIRIVCKKTKHLELALNVCAEQRAIIVVNNIKHNILYIF